MSHHITTRRALLAASAAVPLAAVLPGFAATQDDAELFALVERWRAAAAHSRTVNYDVATREEADAAGIAAYEAFMRIIDYEPATVAGIAAKALAFAEELDIDLDDDGPAETLDQLVVIKLARDLRRLTGRARA